MTLHRKFWLGCLVLAVLFFLYATEERFRGRWALERWKRQMIAQGEKFEIAELTPPAVPESENAYAGLMEAAQQISRYGDYSSLAPPALRSIAPGKAVVTRDLTQWTASESTRQKFGITNVNVIWDQFTSDFQQVREPLEAVKTALTRPRFDAGLDYQAGWSMLVPHLASAIRTARLLSAASAEDLHVHDNSRALDELTALCALANSLRDEPLLISQRRRADVFSITVDAEWQALQAPGWKDTELEALQRGTARAEFLRPMIKALEMERAIGLRYFSEARDDWHRAFEASLNAVAPISLPKFSLEWVDSIASFKQATEDFVSEIGTWLQSAFVRGIYAPLWRYAWSQQDALHYLQAEQICLNDLREAVGNRSGASADATRDLLHDLTESDGFAGPLRFPIWEFLPRSWKISEDALASETLRELAVTAIALKRYELKHGHSASELAALVPEFLSELPRDFMDGQPLRYRRRPDGTFVLYSVGKDRRDDQGDPDGSILGGLTRGRDWVWPTPATAEEIAADDARLKMQDGGTILPEAYSSAAFMKRYGRLMQKGTAQTNAPATGSGGSKSP